MPDIFCNYAKFVVSCFAMTKPRFVSHHLSPILFYESSKTAGEWLELFFAFLPQEPLNRKLFLQFCKKVLISEVYAVF